MKSILIFPHFFTARSETDLWFQVSVAGWGTQFSMDAGMFERAVKHVIYKTKSSEL